MSFVSFAFLILLAVVLLLRSITKRNEVLIAASLVFYAWHVPHYTPLLILSATIDYVAAKRIAAGTRRRAWLVTSLAMNLSLLGGFKYSGTDLVLPIGISFYTFQSMSYTIDVYRGRVRPVSRFRDLLLYISFFPQLVAGPIVRARDFLYQIDRRRRFRARVWMAGGYLIIRGYFLKMVVADNLGEVVDQYWGQTSGWFSLFLIAMFAGQIFGDFAGYSSIARGLAYLLGFRIPVNFDRPYSAGSFSSFWARWHITLSQWLRDYLYVPLGGNRVSPARTYVNLIVVMLLGGLWHGAGWTFVVWGAIHGAALVLERRFGFRDGPRSAAGRVAWWFVVQTTVLVAWIFFRAESVQQGIALIKHAVVGPHVPLPDPSLPLVGLLFIPIVLIHLSQIIRPGPTLRAAAAGVMAYLIVTAHAKTQAFIYFQF